MRTLVRVGLFLAGAAVLLVAVTAVLVPRLAASDDVRRRVTEAVREATGREFTYAELRAGLFPPRVELRGARMAGPTPEAPPFLEAERFVVRVAVFPLAARVVAADPLVVEGATLRMERRDGKISWPRRPPKPREPDVEREPEPKDDKARRASRRPTFAMRTLELRDVKVLMEDGAERWIMAATESRGRAVPCGAERFAVDVEVKGAEVEVQETRALGDFVLQADLSSRKGEGAYRLDATHAEVLFRGYPKPDETPAVFSLNLRRQAGRYAWEALTLDLFGEPLAAFRESPCAETPAP